MRLSSGKSEGTRPLPTRYRFFICFISLNLNCVAFPAEKEYILLSALSKLLTCLLPYAFYQPRHPHVPVLCEDFLPSFSGFTKCQ